MANILIDLTPILPGGENGGAKLMVLELVKQLGKLYPKNSYLLLTQEAAHEELAFLDAHNVQRFCVLAKSHFLGSHFLRRLLNSAKRKLGYEARLPIKIKPDLIFCPFTAPFFTFSHVPVISIIYDLQFLEYPNFFSTEALVERRKTFETACKKASRLICISEFTRQSVIKNASSFIKSEKVVTVPIYFPAEWVSKAVKPEEIDRLLMQYQLEHNNFLIYPANFWKHKNHKILLTAFSIYRKKHPHSTLKLVCTGAPETGLEIIRQAAEKMSLNSSMIFPGYLTSDELLALMCASKALIFPSLYEGFGMPIIEAMLLKKLVLCSNRASLPEVAGEAALYFEPGNPKEVVAAIEKIENQWDALQSNIIAGYEKAQQYLGSEKMARAYNNIFQEVMKEKK